MKTQNLQTSHRPGTWNSPLTPEAVLHKANSPAGIISADGRLFIIESRPDEKGRNALIELQSSQSCDVLPADANIRSKVHEYGGSCTVAGGDGSIFYTEFADQRIYRLHPGKTLEAVTQPGPLRFACLELDERRQLLFAVMEDHSHSDLDPENSIVSICLKTGNIEQVCSGYDFYAFPRLNEDGTRLAFICWNHPNMPWDATELFIVDLDADGKPKKEIKIAGNPNESITQPEWLSDQLLFISDRNGWWNLHCHENGKIHALLERPADFARPMWSIGSRSYSIIDRDHLFVTWCEQAQWQAGIFSCSDKILKPLNLPYNSFSSLVTAEENVYFIGSSFSSNPEIAVYNRQTGETSTIYRSASLPLSPDYISTPESIEFEAAPGEMVQAFYYPPKNPEYRQHEAPPLLVTSHGGPTGTASLSFNLGTQFWTSRGFAVVDVNYSGSAGFGRAYRDRLKGNWGIKDMRDCEKAALYLVQKGLADPERLAIRGGSAGGFTTLCALTFTDTFTAGASHFGLSDLEILAKETHKFESRYMDNLIGPYPEGKDIYRQRSPINHVDKLSCPVIFFQGLDDKVVPPNQAERMFEILCEKGLPTAYVAYAGEGHGFRRAENIKHSLEAELYFFQQVFTLSKIQKNAPVEIMNFKGAVNV